MAASPRRLLDPLWLLLGSGLAIVVCIALVIPVAVLAPAVLVWRRLRERRSR